MVSFREMGQHVENSLRDFDLSLPCHIRYLVNHHCVGKAPKVEFWLCHSQPYTILDASPPPLPMGLYDSPLPSLPFAA